MMRSYLDGLGLGCVLALLVLTALLLLREIMAMQTDDHDDIKARFDAEFAQTFGTKPEDGPPHLRQLPEEEVARLVSIIVSEMPAMPYMLGLELRAFAETRTVHDARRVANALRHAFGRPGLAQEIEDTIDA
jgi:hypothetical protein